MCGSYLNYESKFQTKNLSIFSNFLFVLKKGNPWTAAIISIAVIVVYRVFLGGFALSMAIFALYKLIIFVKRQGSHFNIPQVCLGLEIISNLCKHKITS